MSLPNDLKHYRPSEDAFQIIEESEAAAIFWILLIVAVIVVGP